MRPMWSNRTSHAFSRGLHSSSDSTFLVGTAGTTRATRDWACWSQYLVRRRSRYRLGGVPVPPVVAGTHVPQRQVAERVEDGALQNVRRERQIDCYDDVARRRMERDGDAFLRRHHAGRLGSQLLRHHAKGRKRDIGSPDVLLQTFDVRRLARELAQPLAPVLGQARSGPQKGG